MLEGINDEQHNKKSLLTGTWLNEWRLYTVNVLAACLQIMGGQGENKGEQKQKSFSAK